MLRFFPWYADFLPGGPTPSRMEIQVRSWNREHWEPLYQHAPTYKWVRHRLTAAHNLQPSITAAPEFIPFTT